MFPFMLTIMPSWYWHLCWRCW